MNKIPLQGIGRKVLYKWHYLYARIILKSAPPAVANRIVTPVIYLDRPDLLVRLHKADALQKNFLKKDIGFR